MQKTTNILPLFNGDRSSDVEYTQRINSPYGWINFSSYLAVADNFTMTLEGRMLDNDEWVTLKEVTQADFPTTLLVQNAYCWPVTLLPQVRVRVSNSNASNVNQAFLTQY